jgi:glycosyl hydrolase family 8
MLEQRLALQLVSSALVGVLALACAPPARTDTSPTGSSGASLGGQSAAGGSTGAASSGGLGAGGSRAGAGGTTVVSGSGNNGGTGTGNRGGGSGALTGTGNAGGMGNSSGAAGSGPARGPTPPMNGANFPFPQNRQMSSCVYPTGYDNNDVLAAYSQWKNDLVTSNGAGGFQRVQRTTSDGLGQNGATPLNSTVSEGIGYGMLIAVYMGDPASHMLFDNLWKYEQLHLDANKLMNWSVDATGMTTKDNSGNTVGAGGATDADEDMAFALVMADKQWGSSGALNYGSLAAGQIAAIWNHEVYNSNLAGPGDNWGSANLYGDINISYFAPAYYRVFKTLDSSHAWEAVTQTVFDTIDLALSGNGNSNNGLVPAWCGTTMTSCVSSGAGPFYYQYDSCRTPFRVGVDWCWNGVKAASAATAINPSRSQAYVAKTGSFFSGVGAASIVDGYNLDGTPNSSAHSVSQGQSAAFIGPAGVGAMSDASHQSFVNDAYARLKTRQLMVGGAYYEESWTVISLLMMTGNLLDYTAISPAQ